jgi:hypothetical protein
MSQPSINDMAEAWAQFMHCQLFQYRNVPGLILNQQRVSLPHVRGMLLMRQQVPLGLSQKQKIIPSIGQGIFYTWPVSPELTNFATFPHPLPQSTSYAERYGQLHNRGCS